MNIERLQLAVTMLREVEAGAWKVTNKSALKKEDDVLNFSHKGEFSLSHWLDEPAQFRHCGFSACAVGHMCLDGRFNKLGLVMDWDWGTEGAPMVKRKIGYEPHSWDAVQDFFDIGKEEAHRLFSPEAYEAHPTAGVVAGAIERMIREHQEFHS